MLAPTSQSPRASGAQGSVASVRRRAKIIPPARNGANAPWASYMDTVHVFTSQEMTGANRRINKIHAVPEMQVQEEDPSAGGVCVDCCFTKRTW